jgi:epoxide hydrolase 4
VAPRIEEPEAGNPGGGAERPNVATVRNYLSTHPSQVLKSSYAGFFQLPWLPEWSLRAANFKLLRTALTWTSRPGTFFPNAEAFRPYHDAWARPGALTAMLNWYRALLKHYVRPCERVSVPVRVVWGKRDKFLNCSIAEAGLAQCNDRSTPFYLPNATHWVQHEEPVSVNRLLIEFLCGPSPRQG